ncbi:MAG: EthD family reductase [Pseudomonadales bacterium]
MLSFDSLVALQQAMASPEGAAAAADVANFARAGVDMLIFDTKEV